MNERVTPPPVPPSKAQRTRMPDERYCRDCGGVVSIRAVICPHCGVQQSEGVSKTALLLITLFFGGIGGHKFYLKKYWLGVLYLVFCWTYIPGVIALIEFIVYASTSGEELRRKYTTSSSGWVVALACLGGFVFIGGILAAIAIPQYLNYIARAKVNAAKSNYETAIVFVKSELAKKASGAAGTNNAVVELNGIAKGNPYDQTLEAFVIGSVIEKGQVALSVNDLDSVAIGDIVEIQVDWSGDTEADDVIAITVE